jgi:hypothetical protein
MFLRKTMQNSTDSVHKQPCKLVFDLDEVGRSDEEDRTEKSVIIPIYFKGKMIHHKINQSRERITALICVAVAGDLLPRNQT